MEDSLITHPSRPSHFCDLSPYLGGIRPVPPSLVLPHSKIIRGVLSHVKFWICNKQRPYKVNYKSLVPSEVYGLWSLSLWHLLPLLTWTYMVRLGILLRYFIHIRVGLKIYCIVWMFQLNRFQCVDPVSPQLVLKIRLEQVEVKNFSSLMRHQVKKNFGQKTQVQCQDGDYSIL